MQRAEEKHGMRNTPEYEVWSAMIQRCHNPKNKKYADYGGRGIFVCRRWRYSFASFIADMGRRPPGKLTVQRVDNDAGYKPSNCVWATHREQCTNRRMRSDNSTGVPGVSYRKNRRVYDVRIVVDGRRLHIAAVKTLAEAKVLLGVLP